MSSKIGELSHLNLQDKSHNLLTEMCDQSSSEAQIHIANTIDQLLENASFKAFFNGLTPAITQSPFDIHITEEEVTITDDKKTAHCLKFSTVSGPENQHLIETSKDLLKKINGLYLQCQHKCHECGGSSSSTAGLDPSRATPISTHSHVPESPVAAIEAETKPKSTLSSIAESLFPETRQAASRIIQDQEVLQARLHAWELRQERPESGITGASTLSSQELATIAQTHPTLARNSKLDDLLLSMGTATDTSSEEEAITLLSSTVAQAPSETLSSQESAIIAQTHPTLARNSKLDQLLLSMGIATHTSLEEETTPTERKTVEKADTLQPPLTRARPATSKPGLMERRVHSIREISELTAAQKLIREREIAKELKKQELAGRDSERMARQKAIKFSRKK